MYSLTYFCIIYTKIRKCIIFTKFMHIFFKHENLDVHNFCENASFLFTIIFTGKFCKYYVYTNCKKFCVFLTNSVHTLCLLLFLC